MSVVAALEANPEYAEQVAGVAESTSTSEESDAGRHSASDEVHVERLKDIARALREGEAVPPVTVRTFLSWFWHSQRRGKWIVVYIRKLLTDNTLATVPDFESAFIDADISFVLAPSKEDITDSPKIDVEQPSEKVVEDGGSRGFLPNFADPTYRISKLGAANRTPTFVAPDSLLAEAVTLMMANDFSQLPVMTSERDVKGSISWKSIGVRLALGKTVTHVRDAMESSSEINAEASLFTAIPLIIEHEHVLVRAADRRIVGIITTSDLSLQFQQLSEPFLLLGEIENHIRRILSKCFTIAELSRAKDASDVSRPVQSAADLNYGEYQRLLEEPTRWSSLALRLDRSIFVKLLEKVRETRNDVMHFDPDGIEDAALTGLRDFVKLLRSLQAIGAT